MLYCIIFIKFNKLKHSQRKRITMNKTVENLTDLIKNGYILYLKDGKIMKEKAPDFGNVNLVYSNGKLALLERKETKK